jgi:hypothetical protein
MANTFSCLNIHCVFSTKGRVLVLDPDIRESLWPYMGGIAKQNEMIPKCDSGRSRSKSELPKFSFRIYRRNL